MLFIWTNGIIFHQPRFPWNKTNFPLLFTSIWGDLFWPPLPHPKKKKKTRSETQKPFSMVQSANVITLLKRWWTTNTTPNALLNLRFLVFSWKKGGGSGSVSHWSLAQKKSQHDESLEKISCERQNLFESSSWIINASKVLLPTFTYHRLQQS